MRPGESSGRLLEFMVRLERPLGGLESPLRGLETGESSVRQVVPSGGLQQPIRCLRNNFRGSDWPSKASDRLLETAYRPEEASDMPMETFEASDRPCEVLTF